MPQKRHRQLIEDASFEIKTLCLSWFWKLALNPLWSLIVLQAGLQFYHGYKLNWGGVQLECKGRGYCTSPRFSKPLVQNTFARLCFVLLFTSKSPAVPVQCRIILSDILTSRLAPICRTVLKCPGHVKSPRLSIEVVGLGGYFQSSPFPSFQISLTLLFDRSLSLPLSLSHTHTHNVGHIWRME